MKVTACRKMLGFCCVIVLLMAFASGQVFAQTQYKIIDLGTLGSTYSYSTALNDNGQVVGYHSNFGDDTFHAFSWTQAGGMVDLGTLGGTHSYPNAVNNNGQVVGASTPPGGDPSKGEYHAFLWTQAGGMVDLGTLGGNFTISAANAVNASGQVAGVSITSDYSAYRAFSWTQDGGMVDLGTLGGNFWSLARAMNDNGQVVGESTTASGEYHAFSWTQAGGMVDLGTLGGTLSFATAVNNNGQVVGFANTPYGTVHAFLWSEATGMIDLGTLGGYSISPTAVNNNGQVVGYSDAPDGRQHAFSWTQAGGMVDLGIIDGLYSQAYAVNTNGQVVGYTDVHNDEYSHAFSWTQAGGMIDLGTLGGNNSYAVAVNNGGQVAGYADIDNNYTWHAVLWQPNSPPIADAGLNQKVHVGSAVTLDGSRSSSPDGNLPLSYTWSIASKPEGSVAALSEATVVNPTFTADLPGDYVVQLVVKDSLGTNSGNASVTISTTNTAPVADPGMDQAITVIGTTVQLNGYSSFDVDGDPMTYEWTIISKPSNSNATLNGPNTPAPTFVADVQGTYIAQLVVRDPWLASDAKTITVSFTNAKPVADAGAGQSMVMGSPVFLNGVGSTDANLDPLTCQWSFVSLPTGSSVAIANPTAMQTSFLPDVPGIFVVQLVVNDGFINSNPSTVQIQVTSLQQDAINRIQELISVIDHLDIGLASRAVYSSAPQIFKNSNMKNTLINKLIAVINNIEMGNYKEALGQLQQDILAKTDGCAVSGAPDKNDWIIDCAAQGRVYPLLIGITDELKNLTP